MPNNTRGDIKRKISQSIGHCDTITEHLVWIATVLEEHHPELALFSITIQQGIEITRSSLEQFQKEV